ncbi:hypothetical protein SAMN04489751_1798 [Brevibacterium sandarakinum]|uniref:Uncharacterized protein n=1 Tax=Brevibacterium sandarakinum TaxID=629680 RepID=A0A1H1RF91_BRESA|nr:hypothetical protein SAMN04489751_1798 [Brevibacterium sandarakinum]
MRKTLGRHYDSCQIGLFPEVRFFSSSLSSTFTLSKLANHVSPHASLLTFGF